MNVTKLTMLVRNCKWLGLKIKRVTISRDFAKALHDQSLSPNSGILSVPGEARYTIIGVPAKLADETSIVIEDGS